MADYQAQIRLAVQGLGQLQQLEQRLERATELLGELQQGSFNVGQAAGSSQRRLDAAARRRAIAGNAVARASQTVENVAQRRDPATGRFMAGGPNANARRLASANLRLAQREVRESDRALREELRDRRLVSAAQRRYAAAIDRAANIVGAVQGGIGDQQQRIAGVQQRIGRESRINYLNNLFQGRQAAFRTGGAGISLTPELQQQARNVQAAWDIANAGGRENLQLMQRLATEMAGIVRQQNEINRAGSGRSVAFEAARRGQERLDELALRPNANPARTRRLRAQAADVIAAENRGDIVGARDATRRMNASIARYTRDLDAARRALRLGPSSPLRGTATMEGSPAAVARAARLGGAREPLQGRADIVGSPAYYEEQRKQLARAVRAGGPAERVAGRKDLVGSPAYYEEQRRQLAQAVRAGGPREALQGRKDLPGSPAFIAEQQRQQAQQLQRAIRAGGPAEKIAGRKDLVGSPAYYEEQQKQLARAVRAGGPAEKVTGRKDLVGSPAYYAEQQRQLAQAVRAGGPSSSITGRRAIGGPVVGSPAFIAEQQRRQAAADRQARLLAARQARQQQAAQAARGRAIRNSLESGAIGAGFPLLFGQGAGTSIGGGLGGILGGLLGGAGGFAGGIVGSALGQQFDKVAQAAQGLADSLDDPTNAIAAFEAAGLRLSGALKAQIEQLNSQGRAYEAQTKVLEELQQKLGNKGLQDLSKFNAEQERLQEAWSVLSATIQRNLLPAITGFIGLVAGLAEALGQKPTDTEGTIPRPELTEAQQRVELDRSVRELTDRRAAASEFLSLEREAVDIARDFEDKRYEMRKQVDSIEREKLRLERDLADDIFSRTQKLEEARLRRIRAEQQLSIERRDLGLAQASERVLGPGEDLIEIARQYLRVRDEGEADLQQREQQLQLQMNAEKRDLDKFSLDVADRIFDINERINEYSRDVAKFKFDAERRIADYQIKTDDYLLERLKYRYEYALSMEEKLALARAMGADASVVEASAPSLGGSAGFNQIQELAKSLGAKFPGLAASQWALESGWGRSQSGKNNPFGIKAAPGEPGTNKTTWEVINGREVTVTAKFKDYPSLEAAVQELIDRWYKGAGGANNASNFQEAARLLQRAGYATDPAYVDKLVQIGRKQGAMGVSETPATRLQRSGSGSAPVRGAGNNIVPFGGTPGAVLMPGAGGTDTPLAQLSRPAMGNFLIGNTGRSSGPHLDIRGTNPQSVIEEAMAAIKVWQQVGAAYIVLSNAGIDVSRMTDPGALRTALEREQRAHGRRSPGTNAIDIALPQGTRFPFPTEAAWWDKGGGGWTTRSLNTGNILLHGQKQTPRTPGADQMRREAMMAEYQGPPIPTPPGLPDLPQAPSPVPMADLQQRYELMKQANAENQKEIDLLREASKVIQDRTALQLFSTKAQRQRLYELSLENDFASQALSLNTSLATQEQERNRLGLESRLQLLAAEESYMAALMELQPLQEKEPELYAKLKQNAEDKLAIELGIVAAKQEQLRISQAQAYLDEAGAMTQSIGLTGAGLRAGFIGPAADKFEEALRTFSPEQAAALAKLAQAQEDQQLIWGDLAKDITNVSDAIAGGLTQGLADVITGARTMKDVGREVLDSIANTFLDSAQQQLSVVLQRSFASVLGGEGGLLSRFGVNVDPKIAVEQAHTSAMVAHTQALLTSAAANGIAPTGGLLGGLASQATSTIFQGATSTAGSVFSSVVPNLLGSFFGGASPLPLSFGGFFAEGGSTKPGEAYVVGEEGPELFIPGVSGKVVPRSAAAKAARLQEMDGDGPDNEINVRYEAKEIAGERYVTEAQFRKGMARAAQQGRAMAYSGMRNSTGTRKSLGI